MQVDRYTKTILTLIAVALSVIAFHAAVPRAAAMGDGCGAPSNPCYVRSLLPLDVKVW